MSDFNFSNLRTNGNDIQKQKLIEAAKSVEKYCDSDAVRKMKEGTTGFVFVKDLPKEVGGRYRKIEGQDIVILPADRFEKNSLKSREEVVCHELSHAVWRNNNNPYSIGNSKDNELKAYKNGEASKQKYEEAEEFPVIQKAFKAIGLTSQRSEEDIMKFLNKSPLYKCIPEKEPKTKAEQDKAISAYNACQQKMKEEEKDNWLTKIFKSKKSN